MNKLYHLSVGCADTSIIVKNEQHYLIDAHNLEASPALLPTNKKFKAIFITHQHYDHFDGLNFLRDNGYTAEYFFYPPYERRHGDTSVDYEEWAEFNSLKDYFSKSGAQLYHPSRQEDFSKPYWTTDGMSFWMLGPHNSMLTDATRELHDACLVIKVHFNAVGLGRRCLFTGDASDKNLFQVAATTSNICDDILHASHHGSINGADLDFIKSCKATYTVISTDSGVHSNVPHPTALTRYKAHTAKLVYRTDVDGTLAWDI